MELGQCPSKGDSAERSRVLSWLTISAWPQPKVARDRDVINRMAREHAAAVIRDYRAQPRVGECN